MSVNRIGFQGPGSIGGGQQAAAIPTLGGLPFPQGGLAALFAGGNPSPGLPNCVSLASGGIYPFPSGQYYVQPGRQTVLQWYDPLSACWRGSGTSQQPQIVSCDGTNWRLLNASGVVVGGFITTPGTGGFNGIGATQVGTTITFGTAPTNGFAATGYVIVGGSINTTITFPTAGAGYKLPPTLVIDPPPFGGIQATAQVTTLSAAGAITAVTVLNAGAGYVTTGSTVNTFATGTPNVRVIPAAGETPTTQAVLAVNATPGGNGTLTGIVITNPGSLYTGTTIPSIVFANTTGALAGGVAATPIMSMCLTSITITAAGVALPTATFLPVISTLGSVANVAAGANTAAQLNEWLGARPARATGNTGAGTTVAATSIEDAGFGFQKVPVLGTILINVATAGVTIPTLTAVTGGQTDVSLVQPLP